MVAGDFLSAEPRTPHRRRGKSFPGLTVDQFQRRTSVVMYDEKSLRASLPYLETFAIEGLDIRAVGGHPGETVARIVPNPPSPERWGQRSRLETHQHRLHDLETPTRPG